MKKYTEFNQYYEEGNGKVRSVIPDFHIFRFNELGNNVSRAMGPFKTTYYQFAIGSNLSSNVGIFNKNFVTQNFSIVVFIPGQIIEWERTGEWDGYVINVKSNFMDAILMDRNIKELSFLNSLHAQVFDINEQQYGLLQNIYEMIFSEHEKLKSENIQMIKVLLQTLLIYIGRIALENDKDSNEFEYVKQIKIAAAFKQYVLQHYLISKDVTYYANLLGTNIVMLNRYIKQMYNKTPKEIINEVLILHSKSMLSKNNASIKEIAYELNFDDYSHFVKFFKKMEGISPAEYMKSQV